MVNLGSLRRQKTISLGSSLGSSGLEFGVLSGWVGPTCRGDTRCTDATLAPTFTPTPETILPQIIVTPPQGSTPGVIIIPPGMDPSSVLPTATPLSQPMTPIPGTELTPGAPVEGVPLEPTATPPPSPTPPPTPSPTPTPFIVVESGLVSLRSGPGVEYPLVAQLGPRIPIAMIWEIRKAPGYQLCCVNGSTVWVTAAHVVINNDPSGAQLLRLNHRRLPRRPQPLPKRQPLRRPDRHLIAVLIALWTAVFPNQ